MAKAAQLISDYLDGELDEAGLAQLAELLRNDATVVDQVVMDSFVHSQLHQWMNDRRIQEEILADAFGSSSLGGWSRGSKDPLTAIDPEFAGRSPAIFAGQEERTRSRKRIGLFAALAATVLISATLITVAYLAASHPVIVAQLTQDKDCRWHASSPELPVGSLLHAGQRLRLESGRALLTFTCGAQVVLVGPSAVKLQSKSEFDLDDGRVAAQVPTLAIGFAVRTPVAEFVDLGTEFSLALEDDSSCELQVFDGLVELRLFDRNGKGVEQRLQISEGSAVRFDASRHEVSSIHYDEQQRVAF